MANDCIFCKIGKGEVKSEILYRDDQCFVIKDIAPKAPVHLLVIPHKHFSYLEGLTSAEDGMVAALFRAAAAMAKHQGVEKTGYRLVVNQRGHGGQHVPHLHLHVLGGRQLGAMG